MGEIKKWKLKQLKRNVNWKILDNEKLTYLFDKIKNKCKTQYDDNIPSILWGNPGKYEDPSESSDFT